MGLLMQSWFYDLKHGLRSLLKKPVFSAMAIVSLALGIGANAAIFSLLDAVLFKTLPVREPNQLFFLEPNGPPQYKRSSKISLPAFESIRKQNEALSGECFFSYVTRINAEINGTAEMIDAQAVSDGFFKVLGVQAFAGRTLVEDDDRPGSEQAVAVISHDYWQRRFGGNSAALGQTITLNRRPVTIVGVTPPGFYGTIVGAAPEIYLPSSAAEQMLPERNRFRSGWLPFVLGRLRSGVSREQAESRLTLLVQQSDLSEAGSQITPQEVEKIQRQTFKLESARQGFNTLRQQFSVPLRLLMVLVGLVLLIACANVANLMLARGASRRKEIALRFALGASRWRVMQSLLIESLLLALMGGACGLLLAAWCSGLLLSVFSSGRNPITSGANLLVSAPLDWRVVSFTAAIALGSVLAFGVAPAWNATRTDLISGLKVSGASGKATTLRWGNVLVVAQVAFSVMLLVSAALFIRSLIRLETEDLGFRRDNVLVFSVDPQSINLKGHQIAALYEQMLERLGAIPGVQSVSLSRQGLLSGSGTQGSIKIPGHSAPAGEGEYRDTGNDLEWNVPSVSQVGPRFFETLGMTIVRGRDLGDQDNESAPRVAVINEAFARYYFGDEDPIGQYLDRETEDGRLTQIVGVVKDAKGKSVRSPAPREIYIPFLQDPGSWRETTFQVRTAGNPLSATGAVRHEIQTINPNLAPFRIRTLGAQVDESLGQDRLVTTLAGLFGALALILAGAGLFGVMSYSVSQRTREIGIRMALGAEHRRVLGMILKQGLALTLTGIGLGLIGAVIATKYFESLETMLYGVRPRDPLTYGIAAAGLILVALLACLLPARRATKVDPLVALRYE
ncbi:MAG TPA: ABC transporter permease [Pyrinomonadaceae bacterium]|nr:ABC transporter permease [Pyrinomonadaceae bacterium]